MKHRVFLVEDDAPLASMACDFLVEQGFAVAVGIEGKAAIESITRNPCDAIVLAIAGSNARGKSSFGSGQRI